MAFVLVYGNARSGIWTKVLALTTLVVAVDPARIKSWFFPLGTAAGGVGSLCCTSVAGLRRRAVPFPLSINWVTLRCLTKNSTVYEKSIFLKNHLGFLTLSPSSAGRVVSSSSCGGVRGATDATGTEDGAAGAGCGASGGGASGWWKVCWW